MTGVISVRRNPVFDILVIGMACHDTIRYSQSGDLSSKLPNMVESKCDKMAKLIPYSSGLTTDDVSLGGAPRSSVCAHDVTSMRRKHSSVCYAMSQHPIY